MDATTPGKRIKLFREANGWNQAELARRTGLARGTISRIEAGKRQDIYGDTLALIASALGVSVEYIQGTDSSSPDPELSALSDAIASADLGPEDRAAIKSYLRYVLEEARRRSSRDLT